MMKSGLKLWLLAAALLGIGVPLEAHHSFAAEFDDSKPIRLEGVVTGVSWENPHSHVFFSVTDPDTGHVDKWTAETPPPNILVHAGLTPNTIQPGQAIIVNGFLSKDGENLIWLRTIKIDGKIYNMNQDQGSSAPPPEAVLIQPRSSGLQLAGDPARGLDSARVTIVEFSDFQCPFCARAAQEEVTLAKWFPSDVRFIYKQFPLDQHSEAEFGAEASLAAQAQGRFWEMHDRMYGGFPDLSRRTVLRYADDIGLDMGQFTADLDSHRFRARVLDEEQQGERIGVGGTPTFFINGKRYNGAFSVAALAPVIRGLLG